MRSAASTPTERAIAALRENGAWDMRGRYIRALESAQTGLAEDRITPEVRLMLRANLAYAHFTLWNLVESGAVASDLVDTIEAAGNTAPAGRGGATLPSLGEGSRVLRVTGAFARFVRGGTLARSMSHDPSGRQRECARRALRDLGTARDSYESLADEYGDPQYAAIAHTCRVGILECEAAAGEADPSDAVQAVIERLGEAMDLASVPGGDWLESFGWWAIAGCNIALRHLDGHELHRAMAVCTNKALEIADRLDHWALRERAFTMERFRRQRVEDATGYEPEWLLDEEDVRVLAGTMGRFPSFRSAGWRILESARLFIDEEEGAARSARGAPTSAQRRATQHSKAK